MQTRFSPTQLADPQTASSESVIRKCVHCGFCTATCPTYVLLGDELDSPRGRIYLIKEMLETSAKPSTEVVTHIDRCLSCLSCMTTCPSGVNYMHLVDHARTYIEQNYRRPLIDRAFRALLAAILPHPGRFRTALRLARLARPLAGLAASVEVLRPVAAMLKLAPRRLAKPRAATAVGGASKGRVVFMRGCVESVLKPDTEAATRRLLARAGYAVEVAAGQGCCGALVHHMGREEESLAAARRNIDAWEAERARGEIEAIVITASGCGTTIKNYGFMLRHDPVYSERAARISALACDISELAQRIDLPVQPCNGIVVAYHPACSLQHGQKVKDPPVQLLTAAGFTVKIPAEAHLCCGSAGVYNILQPQIAGQLGDRKAEAIDRLSADIIATGNIGCAVQIGQRTATPVAHVVELLDWAHGGPAPASFDFKRPSSHPVAPPAT